MWSILLLEYDTEFGYGVSIGEPKTKKGVHYLEKMGTSKILKGIT